MTADRCTLDVFGPLIVRLGGERIEVRAGLASAILARLAWSAGELVSTEQMIAALWAEPPANAAGSLRVYVSRLRSGPLGAVLQGGRGGYALDIAADDVDVRRFRAQTADAALLDSPDPSAAARWEEALGLWSAEPFDGLGAFPFAASVREELSDRRRQVLQRLAALRIDRGEAARAVAELEPVVAAEPAHEGLVGALARAHAAAGQEPTALAVIDRFREHILEEEGLDASGEMLALRQAILRRDPSVSAAPAAPAVERHGIPVPLTRLIGRDDDLTRIEDARSLHRLVTLVGPGGAGKTRLAVESVRRATRTIDTEQWMVDLSSVPVGSDVLAITADTLGAAEHTVESIAARVQGRPVLLILDNAEHLLASSRAVVSRLLAACEGLAVLVTSREPLSIAGEFVVRVGGLVGHDLERAVELFTERAASARGGSARPAGSEDAVRRLCRLLDGLPLALELAAARTDMLSAEDLVAALSRGERLPGDVSGDERHASLENTIRWSTDSLPSDELALLIELSGFAGPFTLEAIERVCTPVDRSPSEAPSGRPLRDVALALARKSLIAVDETEDGQRRYRLLESMKSYVRPLRDPAATESWNLRHRTYFAALVDELAPTIRTHGAAAAHGLFDTLARDLQAATEHAVEALDRDMALRLAGGQAWHWFKRGWLVEGRAVIDRALDIPGESDPSIEARALVGIVNLAYQSGDAEAAFGYVARGIERATAGGDGLALASLLAYAAYGRSLFGDPDEARGLIDQAMSLSEGGPDWLRAELLMSRGQTLRALGNPAQALASLDEARALARRAGHAWALTSSEYVAGKILVDVRRPREAMVLLAGGAQTAAAGGDFPGALALLHLLGGATALTEQHLQGAAIFGAVDAIGRRYSYNPVSAEGADAKVHRDRVASGLTARDFEGAYERGTRMSLEDLLALAGSLARRR